MTVGLLSFASSLNARRLVHNVDGSLRFMNFFKKWGYVPDPNNSNATGYPVSAPSTRNSVNGLFFVPNYYGDLVWKWTGTGSFLIDGGYIIRSSTINGGAGNAVNGVSSYPSDVVGNVAILSKNAPRVVLALGSLLPSSTGLADSGVSNGAGGTYAKVVRTGCANSLNTGDLAKVQGIAGIAWGSSGQANAVGTWSIQKINSDSYILLTNTSTGLPSAWNSGDPYVSGGEALISTLNGVSAAFLESGVGATYSSMDAMVLCKLADEATVTANPYSVDQTAVDQTIYLKPKFLRWMDLLGTQDNFEMDFANRRSAGMVTYSGGLTVPAYIPAPTSGSNIFRGTNDAYTCANPSGSGAGGYVDGEIIQGIVDVTNTAGTPTLNVNSRGAKPIMAWNASTMRPIGINIASVPTVGQVMTFRFNASWLNSGTNVDVAYTVQASDTSTAALKVHLQAAFVATASIAAANIGFRVNFPEYLNVYPRTPQAGALSLTYLSGPAVATIVTIEPSAIIAGGSYNGTLPVGFGTFVYNYLADAFMYRQGGILASIPFESMLDLCNRTSTGIYITWPIWTRGAFITAATSFIASGLSSGLQFADEVGNEIWNNGLAPWSRCFTFGAYLDFKTTDPTNSGQSWAGLKIAQYSALSSAAWSAVRSTADHYVLAIGSYIDTTGTAYNSDQLQGTKLTTTNTTYRDYGGLGGGSETSRTANGSRPIDLAHAIGMAPYWASWWWNSVGSGANGTPPSGTVTVNAPWLQASKDYTNGSTATAYAALVNMFNGTTVRTDGNAGFDNLLDFKNTRLPAWETIAAQFDSYRSGAGLRKLAIFCYEGGGQFGLGSNVNNGTNGTTAADISPLAGTITSLGWNVSAYTVSGTNDATEAATQTINMIYNFKFSTEYKNMIKQHYADIVAAHPGREVHPSHYGNGNTQWGIFPGGYQSDNHYSSYDAIHEWDA